LTPRDRSALRAPRGPPRGGRVQGRWGSRCRQSCPQCDKSARRMSRGAPLRSCGTAPSVLRGALGGLLLLEATQTLRGRLAIAQRILLGGQRAAHPCLELLSLTEHGIIRPLLAVLRVVGVVIDVRVDGHVEVPSWSVGEAGVYRSDGAAP